MFKRRGFKRPSPRFSGRRTGVKLRYATEPRRWETADFFFNQTVDLPETGSTTIVNYFHIASIQNSFGSVDTTNVKLQDMVRQMQIGGVVFDYGMEHEGQMQSPEDEPFADMAQFTFWEYWALVYDRLASTTDAAGIPNSIQSWEPFLSGFPISTTPADETDDANRPTRILWSKARYRNIGAKPFQPAAQGGFPAGTLWIPNEQLLAPRGSRLNRRLKVILDDSHGLFLVCAARTSAEFTAFSESLPMRRWAQGQLYYRTKV